MSENPASAVVPLALRNGVPMLKTSSKKIKQVIVRLEEGSIQWASRQGTKGQLRFQKPRPSLADDNQSLSLPSVSFAWANHRPTQSTTIAGSP